MTALLGKLSPFLASACRTIFGLLEGIPLDVHEQQHSHLAVISEQD